MPGSMLAVVRQKVGQWIAKATAPRTLSGVDDSRGWVNLWSGGGFLDGSRSIGWQADTVLVSHDAMLAQSTVFACITLIAADIAKLCLKLVQLDENGIWAETSSPAFSPVLRKPNRFQSMQLFIEQWVFSLLSNGNAYILKVRDARGVVVQMYVLDPNRVHTLVAQDGSVYYQLQQDDLSTLPEGMPAAPASEVIHDRINCLFHPLVGISPLFACALASTQALKILRNSAKFFENMSRPSGILSAPAQISDPVAQRLKEEWERNFQGDKIGKVAVLGDGLKYDAMSINPVDAQLVEQLKYSGVSICAVFDVPPYMVGAAEMPANNNVEASNIKYFQQCLQKFIRRIEDALDDGLGLPSVDGRTLGTMFDLDDLLRMDTATLTAALKDQVGAGITTPNEARRRLNLPPVKGGDTPYLQQQNFALSALAKRDASDDPFATAKPPAPAPAPEAPPVDAAAKGVAEACERMTASFLKALETVQPRAGDDQEEKDRVAKAAADAVAAGSAQLTDAIKTMADDLRTQRADSAAQAEAAEKAAREAEEMTADFFAALERRLALEPACG